MREIILDVETTGLEAHNGDRVTEVGCVELEDLLPTGRTYQTYVNPERDVPKVVQEITGLTEEFLRDKPLFADIASEVVDFIGDAPILAHNASLDRSFMDMELVRCGRPAYPLERWVDTLEIARKKFPGAYNSLDALCRRFDISLEQRTKHGALLDCQLLAEVYLMLNGGRERALEFGVVEKSAVSTVSFTPRAPRPVPLKPLSTAEERAAHAAFVDALSEEAPLWARFGVGKSAGGGEEG